MEEMEERLYAVSEEERARFPNPPTRQFSYGTAGFRDKANELGRIVFRMGLLAALRSKSLLGMTGDGNAIGVMITASHNPIEDNGVKIIDPQGEMLAQEWENYATLLANVSTRDLKTVVEDIVTNTGTSLTNSGHVMVARDTRPSGERLAEHLKRAVELFHCKVTDCGVLTTPQLHYIVLCVNTSGSSGEPTEIGYYERMVTAFNQLIPKHTPPSSSSLKLDGANGVGAKKMKKLLEYFVECGEKPVLLVEVSNDGSSGGVLNRRCGADYVKTSQVAPEGMEFNVGERCASFDGDADRIVYFYKTSEERFRLLDGDKIAALVAGFICEQLKLMKSDLTIGVIQTAYANGSATTYLTDTLCVAVECTMTGVKHLHQKAIEYDIGLYFEANGHGTVLFSRKAMLTFKTVEEDDKQSDIVREAARKLLALTKLINQTVGDAISDLLLVEVVLLNRGWGCVEWDNLYQELPNRQLKVKVKNRMAVQTTDFERKCTAPDGLQREIDRLVAGTVKGRAFIRPSGTEDVVRVYAEATTQESADLLAEQVGVKVHKIAGGVGEPPKL